MTQTLHLIDRLLTMGRQLQQQEQTGKAQEVLEKLAGFHELSPEVGEMAHASLADVFLKQKKYVRARRHLTIALAYRPDCARYHRLLAGALVRGVKSDPDRAEEHYLKSLELDPEQPYCQAEYGQFCLRHDRIDEGLEALRRAVDLDPADPVLLARLVKGLCRSRRASEAQSVLLAARFRRPKDPRFLKLYRDFKFRRLRARQAREQRAARQRWSIDQGPVLLPFRAAPAAPPPGVRLDGPGTLPPPHGFQPAPTRKQRKQG